MDSDKENKSHPSSADNSPDGPLESGDPEEPPQPVSLQINDPRSQSDFHFQDEPLLEGEKQLMDSFPGLAALLDRLKLLGSVGGLNHEMLDPEVTKVESQIQVLRNLREQANDYNERITEQLEYYNVFASKLEKDMSPILQLFGCGLPTEEWHVDAISTSVTAKLRNPKPTSSDVQ